MSRSTYALSEVINLIGGGTPKRSETAFWNGDIPWLSVQDFNNDSRYVENAEEYITRLAL
jgi:type I restriction enzyme S subunit